MIKIDKLKRAYGEFIAVDDISFSIEKGEIVGLLGHNGAGKTTIMKLISGYLEPSSGRIVIDGSDIATDRLAILAVQILVAAGFSSAACSPSGSGGGLCGQTQQL